MVCFLQVVVAISSSEGGGVALFPPIFLLVIYRCIGGSAWIPLSGDSSAWEVIPNFWRIELLLLETLIGK